MLSWSVFNLQFTEVVIILVVALLFLGPEKLPGIARKFGKGLGDLRRATDDLKNTWAAEVTSEVKAVRGTVEQTLREVATVDTEWDRHDGDDGSDENAKADAHGQEQKRGVGD